MTVTKTPYLDGKLFAYSVTYDEALEDLYRDTIPIHHQYGVPANLSVVVSQIGQKRNLPGSSFHGMQHMSAAQLREMVANGWTVSSHSWSHAAITEANARQEVAHSREVLEQAVGVPVTAFIVPGSNASHPASVPVAKECGYLSVYTVTDDINLPGADLYALSRTFLMEEGFTPTFTAYDPYRWLHTARERGGWIVEYCHRATRDFVSRQKEISVDNLRRRLDRMWEVGGNDVWVAPPEPVVDYLLTSRHTTVTDVRQGQQGVSFQLEVKGLSPRVQRRELTLDVPLPRPAGQVMAVAGTAGATEGIPVARPNDRTARLTLTARDGLTVRVFCDPGG